MNCQPRIARRRQIDHDAFYARIIQLVQGGIDRVLLGLGVQGILRRGEGLLVQFLRLIDSLLTHAKLRKHEIASGAARRAWADVQQEPI